MRWRALIRPRRRITGLIASLNVRLPWGGEGGNIELIENETGD